jgi:hypothetical protein
MRLMGNIQPHPKNGILYARKVIPEDTRHAFGGKGEKWHSLRTRDPKVANLRAAPWLAQVERQIEQARATGKLSKKTDAKLVLNPDSAFDAIGRWQERQTTEQYLQHFNGTARPIPQFGREAIARSDLIYALSQPRAWERIPTSI